MRLKALLAAIVVGVLVFVLWPEEPRAPEAPSEHPVGPVAVPQDAPVRDHQRPRVMVQTSDGGQVRRFTFFEVADERVAIDGLTVAVQSTCLTTTFGGVTGQGGALEVPGLGLECPVTFTLDAGARVSWALLEDDEVELHPREALRLRVVDADGAAVSGALVSEPPESGNVAAAASCRTDSTGRCTQPWPAGRETASLEVSAPGFATARFAIHATREEQALPLKRERPVRVTVVAPGFATPLQLTASSADGVGTGFMMDAPGTRELHGLPVGVGFELTLSETEARPLATRDVPPGSEPVDVTLTLPSARRLEVFAVLPARCFEDDDVDDVMQHCVRRAVIGCRGERTRQMIAFGPPGPSGEARAVLEYAPEGPCTVGLASPDRGITDDPRLEPQTVMPPASVTLHAPSAR